MIKKTVNNKLWYYFILSSFHVENEDSKVICINIPRNSDLLKHFIERNVTENDQRLRNLSAIYIQMVSGFPFLFVLLPICMQKKL